MNVSLLIGFGLGWLFAALLFLVAAVIDPRVSRSRREIEREFGPFRSRSRW
jgi:hypothetical protein